VALVVTTVTASQVVHTPGCHYLAGQNYPMLDWFYIILYIEQNFILLSFSSFFLVSLWGVMV
jgi:hypothetical protein